MQNYVFLTENKLVFQNIFVILTPIVYIFQFNNMKKQIFLTLATLFFATLTAFAIELPTTGKYYVFNNGKDWNKYLYEVSGANKMSCATQASVSFKLYLWEYTDDGKLKNAITGHYVGQQTAGSTLFPMNDTGDVVTFESYTDTEMLMKCGGYMNYNSNTNSGVLVWNVKTDQANWWRFEEVEVDADELDSIRTEYTNYLNREQSFSDLYDNLNDNKTTYAEAFAAFFNDEICTDMKDEYKAMTDEELKAAVAAVGLPETFQNIAVKVKNTWSDETDGAISAEFRVQEYGAYSAADPWRWRHDHGRGLAATQLNDMCNPTGIYTTEHEILVVYVDQDVPEGCELRLSAVNEGTSGYDYNNYNNGTTLTKGINIILAQDDLRSYWLMYTLTDMYKKPADMPKLTVHIEGGHVMGHVTFGDRTEDEVNAQYEKVLKAAIASAEATGTPTTRLRLAAKGNYGMCLWQIDTFNQIWGESCFGTMVYPPGYRIYKSVHFYDEALHQEWGIMGILHDVATATDETAVYHSYGGEDWYPTYCNNLALTIMGTVGGSPHSGTGYTHMPGVWAVESSYNAERENFDVWCVAHESGHNNQSTINMESTMESSNNLFSNIIQRLYGFRHSRGDNFELNEDYFMNDVVFAQRQGATTMRMYYNLWLYYHLAGHKRDFYPTLFTNLRYDPMVLGGGPTYNDGTNGNAPTGTASTSWLKFYKKACEAAQEDLTEYFRLWGFFIPCDKLFFGDYSNRYVTCTQEDIDEAIAWVKAQNWPVNNQIIFIDDRQQMELRTDPWATGTEYKPEYNGTYWEADHYTSTYGEVGNYTSFMGDAVPGNYTYTQVGQTVTLEGSGGTGFLFYDSEGKIIYHANSTTVTLPASVAAQVAKVESISADGTVEEIEDVTTPEQLREGLTTVVSTANTNWLQYSDDTKQVVGYYDAEELAALQALVDEAQTALDNSEEDKYKSLTDAIIEELANVSSTVTAQEPSETGIYNFQNYRKNDRYIIANGNAIGADTNASADNAKWQFVPTTDGKFYLLNNSTKKYVSATTNDSGTITEWAVNAATTDAAQEMMLKSAGEGYFYIKDSGNTKCFNLDGGNSARVCVWSEDDGSKWKINYLEEGTNLPKIDYLVVFDQNAKTWTLANRESLQAYAEEIVGSINTCLENSNIEGRFRLAGVMEVDQTFDETFDGLTYCMSDLTVKTKRASSKADIVCVLIENSTGSGLTGSAPLKADAEAAFCCLRCSAAAGDGLVAAHETAHIIGCGHSREQDDAGNHEYAVGCVNAPYYTVCADAVGEATIHIPMFSGPENVWEGVTMGSETVDNSRMIRERWTEVAGFSDAGANNYQLAANTWETNELPQSTSIAITTNTFYYLHSSADWLTATDEGGNDSGYGNGNIIITVKENTSSETRIGTITLEGDGLASIVVNQAGVAAEPNVENLAFFNFATADDAQQTLGRYTVNVAPSTGDIQTGSTTYELTEDQISKLDANAHLTENGFTNAQAQTWIGATNDKANDLTVTISGLNAGNAYNVALVTGLTSEGEGELNSVSCCNDYSTSVPTLNAQAVQADALTDYRLKGVVADEEGKITLTINNIDGAHSCVINCLSIAGVPVTRYLVSTTTDGGGIVYNNESYYNDMTFEAEDVTDDNVSALELLFYSSSASVGTIDHDLSVITVTYVADEMGDATAVQTVAEAISADAWLTVNELKLMATYTPQAHWAMTPVSDNSGTFKKWMGGVAEKVDNLTNDFLFNLVPNGDGWSIQRVSDSYYLYGTSANNSLSFVEELTDATNFTSITSGNTSDKNAIYNDCDKIRFTASDGALNSQGAGTIGLLNGGTGGWTYYACFGPFYIVNITCVGPNGEALGQSQKIVTRGNLSAPAFSGFACTETYEITSDTDVTFTYTESDFEKFTVTSADQLNGTFRMSLTTDRGAWTSNADSTNVVSDQIYTEGTDEDKYFVALNIDNGLRIYHPASKKFVNRNGTAANLVTGGETNAWTFVQGNGYFVVKVDGQNLYFNFGGAKQTSIDSWSTHDAGNKATLYAVEHFTDEERQEAIHLYWKSALETALGNIDAALQKNIGTGLNQYTNGSNIDKEVIADIAPAAQNAYDNNTMETFFTEYGESLTDNGYTADEGGLARMLTAYINGLSFNLPQTNKFYRIRGGNSGNYVNISGTGKTQLSNATDASTIVYYDSDKHLIGYQSGLGTKNTYDVAQVNDTKETATFSASSVTVNTYCIKSNFSGSKVWYDQSSVVNRNSSENNDTHCTWTVEEITDLPITLSSVNDTYFATLYLPSAATVEGADVYVAEANESTMRMLKSEGNIVPASQGVVLNAANADATIHLNNPEATVTSDLTGALMLTTVETDNIRVFSVKNGTEKVGFYKLPSTTTTVKPFRAFYEVEAGNANEFDIVWDETTGLSRLNAVNVSEGLYDMQGRKVNEMKRGNLYIKQGQKIMK